MARALDGRTAIVTGAASGVGLAVAERFLEDGASVMMTDADETLLAQEADRLARGGAPAARWCCDLSGKLGVANLLASVADRFGPPDVLVNAALKPVGGDVLDASAEALDAAYEANIRSVFMLSQAVARRMIAQAEKNGSKPRSAGAIVNLSSIAARRTQPELLAYSISTAALDQMTRSLAVALAPHRIRVNAVAFGSVMSASLKDQIRENDGFRDNIVGHTPLARIGSAAEVAEAAQFLASDAAGFMTGQIVTVDGGRTLIDPVSAPAH